MSIKEVKFFYWLVRHLVPNKVIYFCSMHVIAHSTTGKYGNTVVPSLTAMEAIKRFSEDHKIDIVAKESDLGDIDTCGCNGPSFCQVHGGCGLASDCIDCMEETRLKLVIEESKRDEFN